MAHPIPPDPPRLPVSLMASAPSYSLSSSMNYPSSLLSIATSSSNHHLVPSPVSSVTSATYQPQPILSHQLPPTPNSLVTMMGPNSGSSNSASEQLASTEISVGSVSPVQHQQQSQQPSATSTSWNNLPVASDTSANAPRISLTSPQPLNAPSISTPLHIHSNHQHQPFANHYGQNFQQPRPGHHQSFYNWYN